MKILSSLLIAIPLVFFSSLGIGNEGPITILGLNVAMTKDQAIKVINNRGLKCEDKASDGNGLLDCTMEKRPRGISIRFSNGKIDVILISCFLFNMCEYSLEDGGQALVDSTIIGSLQHEKKFNTDAFCSNGKAGDKVCLFGFEGKVDFLTVEKYTYGSPKPSFK